MKTCWSCKNGDVKFTEKDGNLTKADVRDPDTGQLEGRGWLCDNHFHMYIEDGYRVVKLVR